MSKWNVVFCLLLAVVSISTVGCGGGVEPGVADGPDAPEPVLTPEEKQTEWESARNAAQ